MFNLLKNLNSFINVKQSQIINAKYYSSRMNNAHTMSLANMSAAPQKSCSQWHSFSTLSIFSYVICVGHWPADMACQLMNLVKIYLLSQSTTFILQQ